MNHGEIIRYINFVANKQQDGLRLSPEDYNTLANVYNNYLFQKEYDMVEVAAKVQGIALYDLLHNSSSLRIFKETAPIDIVDGDGDLPEDFVFCYSLEAAYDGGIKSIDIVSQKEFLTRKTDILSDVSVNPIGVLYPAIVKVLPNVTTGAATLVYLRKPASVYYDYCIIEQTDHVVYMPPESYLDQDSGDDLFDLYDGDDNLLAEGVIHPDPAAGDGYESKSVEFEWEERMMVKIIAHILEAMGVSVKDQFLFESAKINQQ